MAIYRGTGGSGDATTDSYASEIAQNAVTATTKATEASQSADQAASSAASSSSSADQAQSSATSAATSASQAETSATTATTKATEASTSADNAADSATAAQTAQTAAEAAQTASEAVQASVETSETNAATSATNAANSATAAASSATDAATTAASIVGYVDDAEASATAAATSAAQSATSATASATSAASANTSKLTAQAAATNASTSATNASSSESAAATSATTASTAATTATTKAAEAAASATAADTSEANAATSASSASASATSAGTSASNAATSAATATTKASEASTSASAAATSATSASSSATSAGASAAAASTSETNAATSETNALNSASAALASEQAASTSETNAATSATNAATSETNAATSETNAANSATSAANSATAANAAKDATLSALDSFDDRYLGAKASDPTVDNDGDPLLSGALYYNTTDEIMKVYEGSQWVAAYASLSGALLQNQNLADLENVATARTNLGLGTAATTNSTAYATSAQGSNADTAFGWGNHALAGYLTSYTETDPVFSASAASGITSGNITNWNTAYGWGNHASVGYLTAVPAEYLTQTEGDARYLQSFTETDPVFTAHAASGITSTKITNWDTAYSWGDHALAGYLTSYTETDPTVPSHVKGITTTDISNWDTAYGWGNHASAGYLPSSHDMTLTLTGDASGSATFTNMGNASLSVTVANDSHSHSNYLITDSDSEQTGHFGLIYWNQGSLRVNSDPRINEPNYDSDLTNIHWWATTAAGANYGRVGHALYNGSAYQYLHTKSGQNNLYINNNAVFHDGYHPNADKWTTARTITLSGDLSGSVSLDGSSNVTLSGQVVNDSHTHDGRYYTESESDSRFVNVTGDTMTGVLTASGGINGLTLSNGITGTNFNITGVNQLEIADPGEGILWKAGSSGDILLAIVDDASDNRLNLSGTGATMSINNQRVFADDYHPNADKWTTARTLSLTGDVTGSVSWDGSGNASITATVANDSHYHSQVFIPDTRGAARAPSYYPDRYTSFDFQNTNDTGAGGDSWHVLQTVSPWSTYNDAHRQQQLAFTGTGGIKFRYATSDSAWAGWQTIWTSGNDGSGSGLDADLLDGQHASAFAPASHSHNYISEGGTSFNGEYPVAVRVSANNFYSDGNIRFQGSDSKLTVDGIVNTPTYQVNGTTVIDSSRNLTNIGSIYLDNAIYHNGDTNTYMQFHASDQWRVVTGGVERLEVNNSAVNVNNTRLYANLGLTVNGSSSFSSSSTFNGQINANQGVDTSQNITTGTTLTTQAGEYVHTIVNAQDAQDGQVLSWNANANDFEWVDQASGGGGGLEFATFDYLSNAYNMPTNVEMVLTVNNDQAQAQAIVDAMNQSSSGTIFQFVGDYGPDRIQFDFDPWFSGSPNWMVQNYGQWVAESNYGGYGFNYVYLGGATGQPNTITQL